MNHNKETYGDMVTEVLRESIIAHPQEPVAFLIDFLERFDQEYVGDYYMEGAGSYIAQIVRDCCDVK
jgi:hypothetical protein